MFAEFASTFIFVLKGDKIMARSKTTLKLERDFQRNLIKELKETYKGCFITKLDPNYTQGSPDLLILYKDKWATLECKASATANQQPNQAYYVNMMNEMSFSRFIYPENKEEVLHDLQKTFRA